MPPKIQLLAMVFILWLSLSSADFNALEENILFKLKWPGTNSEDLLPQKIIDENALLMTTTENEKYKCILPTSTSSAEDEDSIYSGPSAFQLLLPLFNQCVYKPEVYWTYELCHGMHLRQFHEEKEAGKQVSMQEYYLGHYNKKSSVNDKEELISVNPSEEKITYVKVEGHLMPHITVNMTGGTLCDLNSQPRAARIMYVCHPDIKHEIYSLDETSTCEYEVLVLTQVLCSHPDYRLKSPETNEIHCLSLDQAPPRPSILEALETESHALNPYSKLEALIKQFTANDLEDNSPTENDAEPPAKPAPTPYDAKLVQNFLNGEHCLYGGTGWWKYEFCYGKKVDQYHQESDGSKTVISLGKWNKGKHLIWLENNPNKKPKTQDRRHISHLYSDGDQCSETRKYRTTEVRLKCKISSNHPNAVSLTLLEPQTCEYVLLVESPILCELLPKADEYGLIQVDEY